MLEINTLAPDFDLPDETGTMRRLSDFLGKKVVLYFYPKDLTSGCTTQALAFKQLFKEFEKENAVIIGISKDSVSSHRKFKEKYDLPFLLLSDESTEVLQAYGVYQEKSMYGRKYMGVVRSTYVIDEKGFIRSAQWKVSSSANPQEVLDRLLQN